MGDKVRTFKVGSDVLDIPIQEVDQFLKEVPEAKEVKSFLVDKDTLDIPISEVDQFMKEVPNAVELDIKKNELPEVSLPISETATEGSTSTEQVRQSPSDWKETFSKTIDVEIPKAPTKQDALLYKYKQGEVTPIIKEEDTDAIVQQRIDNEWGDKTSSLNGISKSPREWTGKDHILIRDYNNILGDIQSSTQESNVDEYLNAIKSDYQKGLTAEEDVSKTSKISQSLQYKINKAKELRQEINNKGLKIGEDLNYIDASPIQDLTESEKAPVQFLESAMSNSLLSKWWRMAIPEDISNKRQLEQTAILRDYNPSKFEQYASMAVGFMLDAPLFGVLGRVGGLLGNTATKPMVNTSLNIITKDLVKQGIRREIAEGIAVKAFNNSLKGKIAQYASSSIASGTVLGSYGALGNVTDQYLEAYAKGEDLENFKWREFLKTTGEDVLTGVALGVVSPVFSNATSAVERNLVNGTTKSIVAKTGIEAAGFLTEASVFASVKPLLEGRIPTSDELVESGLMLIAIKAGGLPSKLQGKVNLSKLSKNAYEDITYTDREKNQLGIKSTTPREINRELSNLSSEQITEIAKDENIPLLTKYKVMMNQGGIAPVGNLGVDNVKLEKDGDSFVVKEFVKQNKDLTKEELLNETVYTDEASAFNAFKASYENVYDNTLRKYVSDANVETKGIITAKLEGLKPEERELVQEAWDTPSELRTPEQKNQVQKLYQILDDVSGGITGKNAFESPLMKNNTQAGIKTEKPVEIIPEEVQTEPLVSEQGTTDIKQQTTEQTADDVSNIEYIPLENQKSTIEKFTHYKSGDNFYPRTVWADWFLSQDRTAKDRIRKEIEDNPELKNSLLSSWYDEYKKDTGEDITFDEFLNKDIPIYRGETAKDVKEGTSSAFNSFNATKQEAENWAKKNEGKVVEQVVKPKDTLGLIQSVGAEREILVPTEYSEKFKEQQWNEFQNNNAKLFDNITQEQSDKIVELEKNKQFIEAIDYVKSLQGDIKTQEGIDRSNIQAKTNEKQGETKLNEETKNATREERQQEYQGTVQGQQEEGKGTGSERETTQQETNIGDRTIGSETEKEKTLAFSAEAETIRSSFNVPNIKEQQLTEAKNNLKEFVQRWKGKLGLSQSEWGTIVEDVVNIKTANRANKIIDKMLNLSTRRIVSEEVKQKRREISDAFKKHAKQIERGLDKAKMQEVKDFFSTWRKNNRSAVDELPYYVRKMIDKKIDKVNRENFQDTKEFISKVLTNAELADKVNEASQLASDFDSKRIIGDQNFLKLIETASFKKKFGTRGKELIISLNKVPLDDITGRYEILDDYINLMKELNQKGVPNLKSLESFESKYKQILTDTMNERLLGKEVTMDNIEETANRKVRELLESIKSIDSGEQMSIEDITKAKRQATAVVNLIRSLVSNGRLSVKDKKIYIEDPAFKELEELLNTSLETNKEQREKIIEAENKIKIDNLKEVNKLAIELNGKGSTILDNREIVNIQNFTSKILANKEAVKYLNGIHTEYLKLSMEQLRDSKYLPTAIYKYAEKLEEAYKTQTLKVSLMDKFRTNLSTDKKVKKYIGKAKTFFDHLLQARPGTIKDEVLHLREQIENGTFSSPIFTDVLGKTALKVNKVKKDVIAAIEPIRIARYKAQRAAEGAIKSAVNTPKDFLFDASESKYLSLLDRKIGILRTNLRYHDLANNENIVSDGKTFKIVGKDGSPIRDSSDKVLSFNTIEEAQNWATLNKKEIYGEDSLDHFYTNNYGSRKQNREDANFGIPAEKKNELELLDEAYKQMTPNGERLVITNEAEALAKLTPPEQEYYKAVTKALKDLENIAVRVGAKEDMFLIIEEHYTPFMNRSRNARWTNEEDFLGQVMFDKERGIPKVSGNIYEKTQSVNYVDYNISRVMDKYVNEITISSEILPEARITINALKNLSKELADEATTSEEAQTTKNFIDAVIDDYKIGIGQEYNQGTLGGRFVTPNIFVGKGYTDWGVVWGNTQKFGRDILLQSYTRPILDAAPNALNLSLDPTRLRALDADRRHEYIKFLNDYYWLPPAMKEYVNNAYLGVEKGNLKKGALTKLAEWNLTSGDIMTSSEGYIQRFEDSFKDIFGEKFDVRKFNTDRDYRARFEFEDGFEKAQLIAMGDVERTITPQSAVTQSRNMAEVFHNIKAMQRGEWAFNMFNKLSTYSRQQSARYWQNLDNLRFGSNQGRALAGVDLTKQFASDMMYGVMVQLINNTTRFLVASYKDDDKNEQYYKEQMKEFLSPRVLVTSFMGSVIQLSSGGWGNISRMLMTTMYVGLSDRIKNMSDSPEKEEVKAALQWLNTSASKTVGTQFSPLTDYAKQSQVLGFWQPSTGNGVGKVFEGIGDFTDESFRQIQEATGNVSANKANQGALIQAGALILAAKVPYGATGLNYMITEFNKEIGSGQPTKEELKSILTYKHFRKTYDESQKILKERGAEVQDKYWKKRDSEYLIREAFYTTNKSKLDVIPQMMEKINAIPTKTKQELEKFKANPTIENWGMSFDEKRELWAKISQMTDEYSTFYDNLLVASDGQDAIDNGKNIGEVIWAMSTDAMNNRLYVQNKLLNIIISMPIDTTFKDNKSMRKLNMYERLIEWRNEPKEE